MEKITISANGKSAEMTPKELKALANGGELDLDHPATQVMAEVIRDAATVPMAGIIEQADRHPSADLEGPMRVLKDQAKRLADIAWEQSETGEFVVKQGMKFKTTLFTSMRQELDAVITVQIEAKPHVEKEQG